jgi:GNAT superfamily N-acetyltransferase
MATTGTVPYVVRPYEVTDEEGVLRLLRVTLGAGPLGERSAEFFRWKHLQNPFGPSLMLVADARGEIIGLRAFMRWRFDAAGQEIRAVRAVDTATHPDHQGRGIFSRLTSQAIDLLRADTDLIFNTPNEKSLPGYLKLGWRVVGRAPVLLRIKHPVRLLRNLSSVRNKTIESSAAHDRSLDPAASTVSWPDQLRTLGATDLGEPRLTTSRSLAYLAWRYGASSLVEYATELERAGDDVLALAVVRSRPRGLLRELSVVELFVPPERPDAGVRLLRRIARRAEADHVACSFAGRTPQRRSARRAGFLSIPNGPLIVAFPLRETAVDPIDSQSWSLSLGDLEIF